MRGDGGGEEEGGEEEGGEEGGGGEGEGGGEKQERGRDSPFHCKF